ncbi:MAG: hypothetical protein KDK90_05615 [Leptospiraceae bacterium]|nr:hypothetical protein [Leptospiraceae bacterium]
MQEIKQKLFGNLDFQSEFDYANRPLLGEIPVKKRATKRHFGVHGYFTKQTWNVVAEYIKNFTKPGDVVLDPYGGSGVTAIEAMMNNRKAINIDINPKAIMRAHLGMDIGDIVTQTIEGIIAKNNGATLEQINDELIIKGLELGFLDLLKKEYVDLTPILLENFDYNEESEMYTLKTGNKFKTQIDVKLRIRYYLISYLRRMERENTIPAFDEIILYILPLLKNGITPENQTILSVLEDIAEHIGNDKWRLKKEGQQFLFGS